MNKYLEKLAYADSIGGYHFKGNAQKKLRVAPIGGAATPETLKSLSMFTKGPVPLQTIVTSASNGSGFAKGRTFSRLKKKST